MSAVKIQVAEFVKEVPLRDGTLVRRIKATPAQQVYLLDDNHGIGVQQPGASLVVVPLGNVCWYVLDQSGKNASPDAGPQKRK